MGFPYIFRGALDVRATNINEEMKKAAAYAIAHLSRTKAGDEVIKACGGKKCEYSHDYIIPTSFDPRLITHVSIAVAKAAISTGVARKVIDDWDLYRENLIQRLAKSSM